jgi:hypothetical protein
MRGSLLVLLVACTAACSSGGSATGAGGATSDASAGSGGSAAGGGAGGHAGGGGSAGGTNDASAGNAGSGGLTGDAAAGNGGAAGDAGGVGGSDAGTGGSDAGTGGGTYRNSLSVCWTDPYCPRVFAVAHGGAWNVSGPPYDSNAAIAAAYAVGCDGVKIDVRVTKDNVPVISHSSPLQYYESIDCGGKKIEEMTAAQVTQCHRFPSTTEKFQRLDDVLDYLRGKMVVELTVKLSTDIARTIQEVHAKNAEDFAFLEISTSDLQNLIPTLQGADSVYYLMDLGTNVTEVDTLLNTIKNPRAFMYEFDPSVDVSSMTPTRLHPAGVRSFTYTNAAAPTEPQLQALFENGYDVVSSQGAQNGVAARIVVNKSHGVSPP